MLTVPFLTGVVSGGASLVQVPLLIAWLSGYLLSYYALLAVKTRRLARVRRQVLTYAAILVPCALAVLIVRPELLLAAPVFAVLLAVNTAAAWRRTERSVVNDLASVLQSCLMVPLAAAAAGTPPVDVLRPTAAVLLYFVGTVLYVKTMIRERGDRGYLRASIGFHAAAVPVAAMLSPALAGPFLLFLCRAVWLPRRPMTPRRVGFLEIANCVLLVAVIAISRR